MFSMHRVASQCALFLECRSTDKTGSLIRSIALFKMRALCMSLDQCLSCSRRVHQSFGLSVRSPLQKTKLNRLARICCYLDHIEGLFFKLKTQANVETHPTFWAEVINCLSLLPWVYVLHALSPYFFRLPWYQKRQISAMFTTDIHKSESLSSWTLPAKRTLWTALFF